MKITLLIHEKEQRRPDNSGKLLHTLNEIDSNLHCETLLWQRTQPNKALVEAIEKQQAILLRPAIDGAQPAQLQEIADISAIKHFIILDGTWQEARKMYNKSPYLKAANWHQLKDIPASQYNLRRNQIDEGLCTAECAIEILKRINHQQAAEQLAEKFQQFLASDRANINFSQR